MPTRKRPFSKASKTLLASVALLASGIAVAAPLLSPSVSGMRDDPVKTGYPMTAPPSTTDLAGVDLASFVIPTNEGRLTLAEKIEDDGGLVLTFVSAHGEVRAVVRLAVTKDASDARKFLDHQLHGIARILPKATDPALGDVAFADDGSETSSSRRSQTSPTTCARSRTRTTRRSSRTPARSRSSCARACGQALPRSPRP